MSFEPQPKEQPVWQPPQPMQPPSYQQPPQQYQQVYEQQPYGQFPNQQPSQQYQQPYGQFPNQLPPQQYQQPYIQPQQAMIPPQMPYMSSINVSVQTGNTGPGFLTRALYFVFVGWWVGYLWLNIGFALCALIVTLPLGLIMLNRLPKVMTLRPSSSTVNVNTSTVMTNVAPGFATMTQNVNITVGGAVQRNFLLRAIYFIFIGSWLGYFWANVAYLCCATIVLLPVGIIMFDRLPTVLTLRKN
jgi:uncharacterized membrane protein YccF (DUF307 family)